VRAHELTVHFHYPIVGEKVNWKELKNKSFGYTRRSKALERAI
jgi:hypothetical protein